MSFRCEFCGFSNNELQSAAPLKDKGVKYTLKVSKEEDLERMIVAGFLSKIYMPEIDFEIPSIKTGVVTTVRGLLVNFIDDLSMDQE